MNTVTTERCEKCRGIGEIPSGHTRFDRGFMAYRLCPACDGSGETEVKVEITDADNGYLTVGGYRVYAPTFRDAQQFDRAIQRAFDAGLRVEPTDRPDTFLVTNPVSAGAYSTTRTSCSCRAGEVGTPCRHIAIVVFLLDVAHELEVA